MDIKEKRPRLDPHIAQSIEQTRGGIPFDRHVNDQLRKLMGSHEVVADPLEPKRFAVQWIEDATEPGDRYVATGLTRRAADDLYDRLRLAAIASDALSDLSEFSEDDDEVHVIAENLAHAAFELLGKIRP